MPPLARLKSAIRKMAASLSPCFSNGSAPARIRSSRITSVLAVFALFANSQLAVADPKQEMQSLDEQVQEIKSDVLGIAEELRRLEEKLLFPSNTQVAVFVSMPEGNDFRLDSVKLEIDGQPSARHIYSFKELEALKKGGVQRLFTGNVATGAHQIAVEVAGKLPNGTDVSESKLFQFDKAAEPKLIELSLAPAGLGGVRIELGSE